ncbi:cytochrome c maturation protein CcmE [Parasutterella excrementihominis]|jgi:cytochrome c-type biogenesis protein CcmE|uniref:cytochrome c maturation protein CcmE n=1 Tax=Parasutterella excrementihominis TaxID=487175 RepID=UPI00248D0626|nr:cytochrome c maturation protein CcmE [Parasutterella excrementihominis]
MNSTRKKRLGLIAGGLIICGAAAALVFNAFEENLVFFFSPSQVAAHEAPEGRAFRIGGFVQEGSVQRQKDGVTVRFEVTDTAHTVPVTYKGSLPDLFKEGKGVVAQGKLQNGVFVADQVLAKHDENYMPPEAEKAVQDAHKKARAMKE